MGECGGAVSDGEVSVDGVQYSNLVPLPSVFAGEITARLEFTSGSVLTVSANEFSCEPLGEVDPNFNEHYEG
jgi:hypothetical protein